MDIYGVLAEFDSADALTGAVRSAIASGYRRIEAFSPFPVETVTAALPSRKEGISLVTLLGGAFGGTGGYFMQWHSAAVPYAISAGGLPLGSWSSSVRIIFEMTFLGAVICAIIGILVSSHPPRSRDLLTRAPRTNCSSHNRFLLCIRGDDPIFERDKAQLFLLGTGATAVTEVPE